MSLSSTQINFIKNVEKNTLLDSRYTNLECINTSNGKKLNGNFSLIFKGLDSLENTPIAIKFFDPDMLTDQYRLRAFERESTLLEKVLNKKRCLNILQTTRKYNWSIPMPDGSTSNIPIPYFITEWLDEGIEHFSLEQENIECLAKLYVFRDIVLAVNAMHESGISHRDIKLDNLRKKKSDRQDEHVVAIDYGTCAHLDSTSMISQYSHQVGHRGYSSPEALTGLAGDRKIAFKTDIYALGCIMFELFNVDQHFTVLKNNQYFINMITVANSEMTAHVNSSDKEKRMGWLNAINPFENLMNSFSLLSDGNTVPKVLEDYLNKLFISLTHWNFDKRLCSISEIIRQLDICIRILENEFRQQKIIEQKKVSRSLKIKKAKRREQLAIERKAEQSKISC